MTRDYDDRTTPERPSGTGKRLSELEQERAELAGRVQALSNSSRAMSAQLASLDATQRAQAGWILTLSVFALAELAALSFLFWRVFGYG